MKFYRDYCCECGRPESWWSAFKRWLRWSKLGRWWKPLPPPGPYEKYFNEKLINHVGKTMTFTRFDEPKEFPKDAGATTVRFKPVKPA
jgi:hypothetical protein